LANRLLTGKVRLKGFEKVKWVEKKADVLFRNNTDKSHNGELEILSASQERGIVPRSSNNIDIKYDVNSLGSYKKVEVGDYVISLRSFQGGIEYSEYEGIVSPAYTILKEIIPVSKIFYKVYFKTETFINRLNTIIYGIRDGKQIGFKDFATLKLPYPSIEEQTAIANILQCADEEIQLLKKKLQQLKDQKKGLMQVLLTGKQRLVF
jgi:type I restriction enzyme S subunit